MKLTAVVIAKNEENIIKDCLESLRFCDEIVVIDDGSTDKTVEIAKKFTDKVFPNEKQSEGYVEAVRRYAISKSTGEWVLIVDADERISDALADEIKNILNLGSDYVAYKIVRRNYYLGNNPWPQTDQIERLFRREAVKDWDWKLHTSPSLKGEIGKLKNSMTHYTHSNLTSMLNKTIEWSDEEAMARFESNHPKMTWWRFPRVMITAFLSYYVKQGGWKVGTAGLIESIYQSFSAFVTYAKLWELQKAKD